MCGLYVVTQTTILFSQEPYRQGLGNWVQCGFDLNFDLSDGNRAQKLPENFLTKWIFWTSICPPPPHSQNEHVLLITSFLKFSTGHIGVTKCMRGYTNYYQKWTPLIYELGKRI